MPRVSVVPLDGALTASARAAVGRLPVDAQVVEDVTSATGDYLLFVAEDDVLLGSGVRAAVESLESSGADAAVATADAAGTPPALLAHETRTTLERTPALLTHGVVAAVLWRHSWWTRHGASWPAAHRRGTLATALAAASIDVVPESMTEEQARPPRLRRTHLHLRAEDLGDVMAELEDLVAAGRRLPVGVAQPWFAAALEPAVRAALPGLPEADDATRAELVAQVGEVVEAADPGWLRALPAATRLTYELARRGLVAQTSQVVTAERSGALRLQRWVVVDGERLADLPFREDPDLDLPRHLFTVDDEIDVRGRVDAVRWAGDTLTIEGHAYLRLLDVATPDDDRLELALVRGTDGRRVELAVERVLRTDVTVRSRDPYTYDWSGFRTTVDVSHLRDDVGWQPATWRLEATLTNDGVSRTRNIAATGPGGARHPGLKDVGTDERPVRLVPVTARGTFAVDVEPVPAAVTEASVDGDGVVLRARVRRRTRRRTTPLTLRRASGSDALTVPARLRGLVGRSFTARIPAADLLALAADDLDGQATFTARLAVPGTDRMVPLRAATGLLPARGETDGRDVEVVAAPHGRLQVAVRAMHPVVDAARWDDDVLELSGRWPAGLRGRLVLAARRTARERDLDTRLSAGRFTVRLAPGAMPSLAGDLPLPYGNWLFLVRTEETGPGIALTADAGVLAGMPMERTLGTKPFALTEDDGDVLLEVGPDLTDDERGPVNQQRLRRVDFPAFLRQGLVDEVLFESYESRAYGDNARAIYEELRRRVPGLRCRWMVVDGQTALPEGLEPVRRFGRDHFQALARARYVVVPNYRSMESWFETPREQVVVQTWHGAPFKRIGLDNPRWDALTTAQHGELIRRESARWDYLLSPNPPSTPILRGAFGYDGEVLETGYPRTDVFHAPDRAERAAAVRRRLGLEEGRKVVLYAPTMRDDHRYSGNRYSLDMRLDIEAARRELADDHVLLVRRHAKVVDSVPGVDGRFAVDVSAWPDVNELLLAVDVLVSDYSSLMFDFAVTGRPMLFFTYDLADYRDRLRGFYFDPDRQPGPHLMTSAEIVAAVRDIDDVAAAHRDRYAAFRADFTPWDDGHAAQKLVERVFREHL